MPVAILGDRSCGKTVFLSLLYESQVRYSNDLKNKGAGEFRFNTDPTFEKILGDLRTDMMAGHWADSTLKGKLTKYRFKYGYRKTLGIGAAKANKFQTMDFTVYDIAGEDLDIIRSIEQVSDLIGADGNDAQFNFDSLSESFRKLLNCNVFVFLVDMSRINAEPRTPGYTDMRNYDVFMATLISAVSKYKAKTYKNDPKRSKIYPVFVLTKFDIVNKKLLEAQSIPVDYKALEARKEGLLSKLSSKNKIDSKEEMAKRILSTYYGDTMALSKGGALENVSFDKAAYFFSEIFTEQNEDGDYIPMMKRVDSTRHGLHYSDLEYRDFIDYFRVVANDMPDEVMDEQDFEGR